MEVLRSKCNSASNFLIMDSHSFSIFFVWGKYMSRLSVDFLKYSSQQPHLADKQTDIPMVPELERAELKFKLVCVLLQSQWEILGSLLHCIALLCFLTLKYVWKGKEEAVEDETGGGGDHM